MTRAFSWQNSISLCPASFCTPRPNLPVNPGISWLPTFASQSPMMKRTFFLGVSSRRSCSTLQNHSTSASPALGDDRVWDGWMASPTQWTWVWVNSGSWWWTGKPGMLRFVGSQRVGHDWATELNWTELKPFILQWVFRWSPPLHERQFIYSNSPV